jgi:hypothetical protein
MTAYSMRTAVAALALGGVVAAGGAQAGEADFFNRFAGSFSGSGQVQRNSSESPNQVQCTLTGRPSANGVAMAGECGAFIFSKRISADIRYDEASGRYHGSYVGSSIGTARLSGARRGDSVVLTITWPQPVNGDTKATMTISNSGNGRLAISITDKVAPDGPTAQVTQLALARSGGAQVASE